jgi:hypothetical protein
MAKSGGGGKKGASIHVISSSGRFVKKGHSSKMSRSSKSVSRSETQNKSSNGKAWSVRTTGSSRAGRVFPTKEEAVGYARDVARKHGSEVYIHRRDGMIVEKDSYSRDPHPPRDSRSR